MSVGRSRIPRLFLINWTKSVNPDHNFAQRVSFSSRMPKIKKKTEAKPRIPKPKVGLIYTDLRDGPFDIGRGGG